MSTKCVVNKSTLTGIANAIRAKDGSTDTMLPSAMAAKIEAIPTGGSDGYKLQGVLSGSLEQDNPYVFNVEGAVLRDYAFYNVSGAPFDVYLTDVTSIGAMAFRNSSVGNIYGLSMLVSIGDNAIFMQCKSLSHIDDLISCARIGTNAFNGCQNLTYINAPNCTTLGQNAFITTTSLTEAHFGSLTSISTNSFPAGGGDIYLGNTTSSLLGFPTFPSGAGVTTVFHCSDGLVKYIGGAWTAVTE